MAGGNKAHTATVNRLLKAFGGELTTEGDQDAIRVDGKLISVETSATLSHSVARLVQAPVPQVYVAVTNRESLALALAATHNTRIGVMDPQGQIVRPAREV